MFEAISAIFYISIMESNFFVFEKFSSGLRSLFRREGAIPPELGQLKALGHLYLDHNQLDGEKPSQALNGT